MENSTTSKFSRESQNIVLGRFAIIYFSMCSHLLNYQFAKNFWIKKVCRLLAHIDQRSPWAFIFIIIAFYFLWFWQNRVWYLSLGCEIIWEWVDLMVIGRDPRWGLGSGLGHHDADTRSIADGSVTMPGAGNIADGRAELCLQVASHSPTSTPTPTLSSLVQRF